MTILEEYLPTAIGFLIVSAYGFNPNYRDKECYGCMKNIHFQQSYPRCFILVLKQALYCSKERSVLGVAFSRTLGLASSSNENKEE